MDIVISATHLAKSLSDILSRIRYRGERFVIERNGESVATMIPATPSPGVPSAQVLAQMAHIMMPCDGFADDVERIQQTQPMEELAEWPS